MKRPAKRENHPASLGAKVAMRQRVLDTVKPARVLEAFCGHHRLFREVWHRADRHVGCDMAPWAPGDPVRFVCDNRRLKLGDFGIVRQQSDQRGITARTMNALTAPSELLSRVAPK
jgi:hypothetical protein